METSQKITDGSADQVALGRRQAGIGIAGLAAVVSGCAVFVNGYGVRAWADLGGAVPYTTAKNVVAAIVIGVVAVALTRRGSPEGLERPASPAGWASLVAIAIIGGSVPFVLFFAGLATAGSSQAGFIHKTLVVWVALLAVVFLRERIGPLHVAAVLLLVWGQATIAGGIGNIGFGRGELMILGATLLWSVEVVIAKRLLRLLSAATIAVARMAGGGVLLVGYGLSQGAFSHLGAITMGQVLWVAATGVVLAGFVATWLSALARAPAVDVTAVLVGGALVTAALNVGVAGAALPAPAGLALIGCGVVMVLVAKRHHGVSAQATI